jgi:hypothetical protein
MNKSIPLAAALVLLLSSCAHMYPGKPGDPRPTRVAATEGRLTVNQEPIYVGTKDATIVWYVSPFSSLRFPRENAVTFREAPEGEFRCATAEDGRSVSCLDRYSRPGTYKYTIRVTQDGAPLEALDPSVVNR